MEGGADYERRAMRTGFQRFSMKYDEMRIDEARNRGHVLIVIVTIELCTDPKGRLVCRKMSN